MLITCTSCESKMRVPESAAGKRVKCPKCATLIRVPEAEVDPDSKTAETEGTGISSKPIPAPPPAKPDPEPDSDDDGDTGVTEKSSSSGSAKPPPLKPSSKRSSTFDDGDDDDDDRDDEDDDRPSKKKKKKRRRDDDDDDDDDLDVSRRGRGRPQGTNGLATTAMILGITGVTFGAVGLCCCTILFEPLAGICGGLAIIFGFMGKTPGSEGPANTGIICGFVSLALVVVGILLVIFVVGLQFGLGNFQQDFNRRPRF